MSGERGQATVEWIALLLLVALGLAAVTRLAPSADGHALATSLAHSVTRPARHIQSPRPPVEPLVSGPVRVREQGTRRPPRQIPAGLRRVSHDVRALSRRAWFSCLVYERVHHAVGHPESRLPGYTIPTRTAIRMVNNCLSPVGFLTSLPGFSEDP
jgi:hypothetical protein